MVRWSAAFDSVRCLVSPEPITTAIILQHRMAVLGIADRFEDFKSSVRLRTSIGLEQRVPQEWAKSVYVPAFLYGVRDDVLTDPSDVQTMFRQHSYRRKEAAVDREHDSTLGWLHGVPASPPAHARLVRAIHMICRASRRQCKRFVPLG